MQFALDAPVEDSRWAFSSLFIGMGLAIIGVPNPEEDHLEAFSSLFIGMGLAISYYSVATYPVSPFSSLFIGMGLAIISFNFIILSI